MASKFDFFLGEPTVIQVNPGDYGTKFLRLEGTRPLAKRHSKMVAEWERVVRTSALWLVDDGGGSYAIGDGQNRIYVASHIRAETTRFAAWVTSTHKIRSFGMTNAEFVRIVSGRLGELKWTAGNTLSTYHFESALPDAFKAVSLYPGHKSAGKGTSAGYLWTHIVRGIRAANSVLEHKAFPGSMSRGHEEELLECWRTTTAADATKYARILTWWAKVATEASQHGQDYLWRPQWIATGILLAELNPGRTHLLNQLPSRLQILKATTAKITFETLGIPERENQALQKCVERALLSSNYDRKSPNTKLRVLSFM